MNILGISCFYHDASATLIKDGVVTAAAEEERFSRVKHDTRFPANAIKYCLKEGNIDASQLDYIGFYEKPLIKFERLISQYIDTFPKSFMAFERSMPSWLSEKMKAESVIRKNLKYKGEVLFIDHHLSHAASAFLVSPFRKAALLTADGVGEWSTTTCGIGENSSIRLLKEIRFPHSLGLLYSTVTAHLGFSVNNSEYKVMGLSAYGQPTYYDKFRKIIEIRDDGSYALDMSYFDYHFKLSMPGRKFLKEFGAVRKKHEPVEQRHKDIAASLQKVTEEALFKMLNHLYKETKCRNLCMAGGVALNSVANGKIKRNTPFRNIWIQPASSDAGGSMGVAFYIYNTILGNKRKYVLNTAYLGPSFSRDYIKNFLVSRGIKYRELEDVPKEAAKLIYNNNVVGLFQGRMEWGPRALGNRSILSNPCNPKMKEILNLKVKHREEFRPFAPAILKEHVHKFFDIDKDEENFMLFVYPIKESKRKLIPAVTHVDGTGRLQTISRKQNPLYYDIIKEFGRMSGVPVVINTSFNIRGEPIVCTPEEAYKCMTGTGIDYLLMGNFLVPRQENKRDWWNSEKIAED